MAPGESKEVIFVLGQATGLDQIRRLVRDHAEPERARESFAAVSRRWDDILNAIQVSTPDIGLNLMLNRWLLYQVLACRVWARTSNYQSGGAYGFRDQLQDVMALVYSAPSETRSHILRAAAHQFKEGDVQHWWHPPSGVGVRTRMTDDLYFLPYVVHHYVLATGDVRLLDELVPFIRITGTERRTGRGLQQAGDQRRDRHRIRTLHTRAGAWLSTGSLRFAPHGNRRLERWHEQGWRQRQG